MKQFKVTVAAIQFGYYTVVAKSKKEVRKMFDEDRPDDIAYDDESNCDEKIDAIEDEGEVGTCGECREDAVLEEGWVYGNKGKYCVACLDAAAFRRKSEEMND